MDSPEAKEIKSLVLAVQDFFQFSRAKIAEGPQSDHSNFLMLYMAVIWTWTSFTIPFYMSAMVECSASRALKKSLRQHFLPWNNGLML